jgi:hypothetical protein
VPYKIYSIILASNILNIFESFANKILNRQQPVEESETNEKEKLISISGPSFSKTGKPRGRPPKHPHIGI